MILQAEYRRPGKSLGAQMMRFSLLLLCTALICLMPACSFVAKRARTETPPPPVVSESLRPLAPPEGLKVAPLFSERTWRDGVRLDRLETAVQTLRNDVDVMAPAVVRGVEIEKERAAKEAAAAAEAEAKARAAEEAAAAAAQTLGNVLNIRFGDYADKTRVVLDMTGPAEGAVKVDGKGKILAFDLSRMKWLGKTAWDAESAQLVSGYRVEEGRLLVNLMYPSKITAQKLLPPSAHSKNYRLMVDLFSPEVHKK